MRKTLFLVTLFVTFASALQAQILDPAKWQCSITNSGEIIFQATIDPGWHLYDMNLPKGGPIPTSFTFDEVKGAELSGKVTTNAEITSYYDDLFGMDVAWYNGNPRFTQQLTINDPEAFEVNGYITYMVCNDETCVPGEEPFSVTAHDLAEARISGSGTMVITKPENRQAIRPGLSGQSPFAFLEFEPNETTTDYWTPVTDQLEALGETQRAADRSWLVIFISGFIGGLLALLTPCVWPIIPMTISFFLKRSNKDRRKAVRDAFTYGLSIIVIYLTLGLLITALFGASALNELSTSALFNLLFFALLVVFAISFFGAFEITLPASWANKMDRKAESTSGLLSIFFMAFTLVLVSFSCTGPIIGFLLVEAAGMSSIAGPAIGMFGFALALAIPFALFAIFPSWLTNLPQSGGWLNSVKVVLGFLELAFALKFLSVADLAYGWGILDREVFLVLWIVLFALLGFYLLGKIRFPHDSETKHVTVPRFFLAIASLAFALYMLPGLWGAPLKAISAFAPPLHTQDFSLYDGEVRPQFYNYDEGMAYAARHGKPVLLDFTGHGCVNCREMEAAVWSDPRVKQLIDNDYVLISLYVDDKTALPEVIPVEEEGKQRRLRTVGDQWSYLQRHKFATNAQPYYVLLDNDGMPLNGARAYNKNIDEYLRFLQEGLQNYKR